MKWFISTFCAAMAMAACNSADKSATIPSPPQSVADVLATVQGKTYKVFKLGLLSPFASDSANPVNWKIQQEDTSRFFRDYAAKQQAFTLSFGPDSTVRFWDVSKGQQLSGSFSVDATVHEGYDGPEKTGIKLRLHYNDSMALGSLTTAAKMTLSYLVKGMDTQALIVETGQSYNRRPLVLWLKKD